MKSFAERSPFVIGIVGTVALAGFFVTAMSYEDLPIVGAGTTYQAEFAEAAGLQPDDEVRVAGIKVGEVTGVALAEDHVKVDFKVKDAWIGNKTTAEIKIKTLLGRKFLSLYPIGDAGQDPKQPIPRARTTTPYDVTDAFNGLSNTLGSIDTNQLAQSFRTLSDTFKNAPQHVRTALDGLSSLSATIASRDDELAKLVGHTREISATLAGSNTQFDRLINDGNLLLTELNNRRGAIHSLLTGAQQLAEQLIGLVADNRRPLETALGQLNTVTGILQANIDNIDRTLQLAGPYFRIVNNTLGSGRWTDSYLCGLVPENRNPCTPPKIPGGG